MIVYLILNMGINNLRQISNLLMHEGKMNSEYALKNNTIEKLKYLLGNFNSLRSNIDIYSQCIKKSLNENEKLIKNN